MDSELNVEQFSQVCRTCLSKNFLGPIDATFQDNTVENLLRGCIPHLDIEDKRLPQKMCSVCLYHLRNFYGFKLKCMKNEALLKSLLSNSLEKMESTMNTINMNDPNINVSNDELPKKNGIKTQDITPERNKEQVKHRHGYHCQYCKKSFSLKHRWIRHTRVHTKDRPYKCEDCNLSFTMTSSLNRHKMIHSGERPHMCQICGKGFIASKCLKAHRQKCHTVHTAHLQFTCKFCDRVFKRQGACNLHIKKHHPTEENNIKLEYKCKTCGKEFAKLLFLKKHEIIHGEKTFLCSDCGKGFVRKADLQSHTKVHTGERPYVCQICKKSFAHAGSLFTHNLGHTGHKPFKCAICHKSFSQQSHLKIHQRTHSGERPYACTLCGKTFALKTNFTVHTRTHTGETPFNCPVCGKGFYCSSSMKKHKNTHTIIPIE